MSRRSSIEQAGAERRAAIRACRSCDASGWRLGPDGLSADLARRCDHSPPPAPAPIRDITEPLHESDLFTDTERNK